MPPPPPPPPSAGEEEEEEETEEARARRNAAARAASAVRAFPEGLSASAEAGTKEPSAAPWKRQPWRWILTIPLEPARNLAASSTGPATPPDDDDDDDDDAAAAAAAPAPALLNAASDLTCVSTRSQFSRKSSFSFG